MIDNTKIVSDVDKRNKEREKSIERDFSNKIEAATKDNFKRIVGIPQFGYSPSYSENYDKIDWR